MQMENQIRKLQSFYNRYNIATDELEEVGDEKILGDCWEWQELEHVEF